VEFEQEVELNLEAIGLAMRMNRHIEELLVK